MDRLRRRFGSDFLGLTRVCIPRTIRFPRMRPITLDAEVETDQQDSESDDLLPNDLDSQSVTCGDGRPPLEHRDIAKENNGHRGPRDRHTTRYGVGAQ